MKETLIFKRMAYKAKDSVSGFLYIHSWGTGWQELVFPSKEAAEKFIKQKNEVAELTEEERKIYYSVIQNFPATKHESALQAAIEGGKKFQFIPT